MQQGKVTIALQTALAVLAAVMTAVVFYFTTAFAMTTDIRENKVRLDGQEKRLERIEDKVDQILIQVKK